MKKIFPMIMALLLTISCTSIDPAKELTNVQTGFEKTYNTIFADPKNGILYSLILLEAKLNVSSLIFDKTKEEVEYFSRRSFQELPKHSTFYVMPAKVERAKQITYDDSFGRMVRNYIFLTGRGDVTTNLEDADYIVLTDIKESIQVNHGTNYSIITITIMNSMDFPVFFTSLKIKSSSDENFWYYPTKNARPVKQLTLKGMGAIMDSGMPAAFGDPATTQEKMIAKIKEFQRIQAKQQSEIAETEDANISESEKTSVHGF